ncbi:hypothetical protein OEZ85_005434 [Tetradesmus obliquus]|uniref:Uncharacterized protein n=1 Tax=Tetradesmus obliquus TaxID=3088 RepID=A0ABY8UIC2_TETOB|nr:hypothetical protein OEZ85_005434 [Tetradesmus obliquus]
MARSFAALVMVSMVLAVAVQAHAGRKMQQLSQQVGSRATAAQADTAAKINAAIDGNKKVKPSQNPSGAVTVNSAHTQKPTPGSASVTTMISSTSKSSQGAAASAGTAVAAQSATEAKINAAASGAKPTKPAAPAPKVTTTIATTSKTGQGAALSAGTSTAAQAATGAMINSAASGAKPATKP